MIPNRPKTRFEWRIIENPSTRLRLRAMCNEIKKELLGNNWSPYEAQTTQLFKKLNGDYFDQRTYESWWKGEHYPQKKHIEQIEKINKKCTYWLEHTPVGSPLLRHLYAIDTGCFQYTKDHIKYHKVNEERLNSIYKSINTVWEIFTTDGYKTTRNILDFTQQAPNAQVDVISNNELYNTNSYNLPREVLDSYRHDDPKSIFLFLIKYSMHTLLLDPAIFDIWVLEMASLSLILGKAFYESLGYDSRRKLGELQNHYEMYRIIFFSSEETVNDWSNFTIEKLSVSDIDKPFREIRARYHEMLLGIGITPEDMRTIISYEPRNFYEYNVTQAGLR